MKKLVLLFSGLLFSVAAFAQFDSCEADASYQDSLAGVYPLPYDAAESPDGGIPDSACLNKDYQFIFTAVVNDTLNLGGTMIPLDSLVLATEGAVSGLPEGIDYACNPPNCVFYANTIGCVVLYGKPTNMADLGDNELVINAKVYGLFFPLGFDLAFPNAQLYPGTYSLYVHEENYPNCSVYVSDIAETALPIDQIRNIPNPFSERTTIEVVAREAADYQFEVSNLVGERIHTEKVRVEPGANRIEFDGSQLSNGIYLYSFRNENGVVTRKMVINR
ncbi:MAG: T9SS type A sorting domain-containing protein [Saprospiraceae bacterium]|nr:T9SS type A sorting domain-containing protein [Saprospiraceae bacterium]